MKKKDLVRYSDPFSGSLFRLSRFNNVFDELDRFFNRFDLDTQSFSDLQPKSSFPKVNIVETAEAYEVEMALAGFDKEDVELEIKDNCLFISADKKKEVSESDKDKKYLIREISSRSFKRTLSFPKKIKMDGIACNYTNGIISCVFQKEIPKREDDILKIKIN